MRNSVAIRALLVALPLIAIGTLAARSLQLEYGSLTAQQAAARGAQLQAAEAAIDAKLEEAAGNVWSKVSNAAETMQVSGLRAMVLDGTIDLAVIHQGDRRVFPPEDETAIFIPELRKMQLLTGVIASARADFAGNPSLEARSILVRVGDDTAYSFFQCRRAGPDGDICILLGPSFVLPVLRGAIASLAIFPAGTDFVLRDPEGRAIVGVAGGVEPTAHHPLRGTFRGWQLDADLPAIVGTPWHSLVIPIAIALPLLVSWLTLAWHFHRAQREHLAEVARRAEITAQLSHELRTPLTNLRLYTDLIRRKGAANAAVLDDYCGIMESEIDRLGRLTENAIAFARSDNTESPGNAQAIPDEALQGILARHEPILAAASCPVTISGGAGVPCRFDLASFERIVVNLLDNARKYAAGGPIEISTAMKTEMLSVAVRDYGPGIAPGDRERIFEPLNRGSRNGTDGFGLGLAAVRRLARANGGDARVEDAHPGARFVVSLRVAAPIPSGDAGDAQADFQDD